MGCNELPEIMALVHLLIGTVSKAVMLMDAIACCHARQGRRLGSRQSESAAA